MSDLRNAGPCYLVASDPKYHFGDSEPIQDGFGAFVFELDDQGLVDTLLHLFKRETTEHAFELSVLPRSALTTSQLVLAKREVSRAESIGRNLNDEEYRTQDPVFQAIGWSAIRLDELASELKHVLADAEAVAPSPSDVGYATNSRFLQQLPQSRDLKEALDKWVHVLERHRLLFLFFSGARRQNPLAVGRRSGMSERVVLSEMRGYEHYQKEIDVDGAFLFRNRSFLDRYADEAIGRFGPGDGQKVDAEGASYPYWSTDEQGVLYLQESADVIHTTASEVRSLDTHRQLEPVVTRGLEVAHDRGKSRWYSSVVTRWAYLAELDSAIADAKRASVHYQQPGHSEDERPSQSDEWCYLIATFDESMFNHDPGTLGRVVGDPHYYPIERGTLHFFKVRGDVMANRLVRLFDRGIKPHAEREDEIRVRVSFSFERADALDEDHIFLIEEEIEEARAEVEQLDRDFRLETGPRRRAGVVVEQGDITGQRRPLSGDLLSRQRLYDQAQRWYEKLLAEKPNVAEPAAPNEHAAPGEASQPPIEPASEEILRFALPTAVMAACALRDLIRVQAYYPDAISAEEAKALKDQLAAQLVSAAEVCKLDRLFEIAGMPEAADIGSDQVMGVLMGMLMLHHPDHKADPPTAEAMSEATERVMRKCQDELQEPVRGMVERVIHAIMYDCRIPSPRGIESFREPQRFLQMLRAYWGILRQLVLHHIDSPIGYRPHPLMPLVVNLRARCLACFEQLAKCTGEPEARETFTMLIDIVLSGEPDELQVVPEWSYDHVGKIDRFIEEARLALGAKSYPWTPAEEMCLEHAQKVVNDYEKQVKVGWSKMLQRIDAKQGKQPIPNATPLSAPAPAPAKLKPFKGGEMVFFQDRIDLCGITICTDGRPKWMWEVLTVLREKRADGRFASFGGGELAARIGADEKDVARVIRDIRDSVIESLRNSDIECGRQDVILSGGPGYRFADSLIVQLVETPAIMDMAGLRDASEATDVPADDIRDDAAAARRVWILQELANERQLKAPDVAEHFSCSVKTAQRDLTALKDEGRIEFVGAPRTGFYRLCQPASP